jgi:hypothetical protein
LRTLSLFLVLPFLILNIAQAQSRQKCDVYDLHIDPQLGILPREKIASVDMTMDKKNDHLRLKFSYSNKYSKGSHKKTIESNSYNLVDIDPYADVYISSTESDNEQLFVWKSLNDQVPYKIVLKVDGSDLYHLYCTK